MMISISFKTFGCKLNFAETTTIMNRFDNNLFKIVEKVEDSDVHIIHSCTVTEQAEKKCRQAIRRASMIKPDIKIVILGCYAQLHKEKLNKFHNIIFIQGNESKYSINTILYDYFYNQKELDRSDLNDDTKIFKYHASISDDSRTRSFLKIQDGCDYFCTYCAVPYARGKSRSDSIENIIKLVKSKGKEVIKEVVLTGVNIGTFGNGTESLYDLICKLSSIDTIKRIRLSSIEPNLLESKIIDLAASSDNKIMPHFHIPLQSGSDKILKLMKRHYDTLVFKHKVEEIIQKIPDACIAVDLITGFPGETDDDFEATCSFAKSLPIAYLHIFSYSDRQEAIASKFENKVSKHDIIERSKILHEISHQMHTAFIDKYTNTKREVLFEMKNKQGNWIGWTDNYIRTEYHSDENLKNHLKVVQVSPYYTDIYKKI